MYDESFIMRTDTREVKNKVHVENNKYKVVSIKGCISPTVTFKTMNKEYNKCKE